MKAAQYVASHPGEVCPAAWKEGEKTLAPSLDLVGKILNQGRRGLIGGPSTPLRYISVGVPPMLDANLKTQLKGYLERLTLPVELVASLDGSPKSAELRELLQEIASLSDKVRKQPRHAEGL